MSGITAASRMGIRAITETTPLELRPNASQEQLNAILRAIYRQVLGNDHLFASDRKELASAESLLRQGSLTVREFVRLLAKSEAYKRRFLYPNSQTRAIELNFKHLLGRAPTSSKDIARHLDIYHSGGHSAEIDSYIDSPEYLEAFGDNIVPHPRGFEYRKAHTTRDFTNLFALYGGYANNDRSQGRRPRLMIPLATGFTPAIRRIGVRGLLPPSPISKHLGPPTGQSDRMFCIEVTRLLNPPSALATSSRVRKSNQQIFVSADQLSATMQRLLKAGAKIVSVRSA
ncbi:phycobilisome rod-core linker polypeptide [Synechococcus sp. O70.2]|jgi:phycocyanin-associated rod linker protein|uniref:phycobilisome rod-core linker polypeptide n=1 Tax=unclassified Synechococcus TaxID=2626047 RepID=UPI0039C25291